MSLWRGTLSVINLIERLLISFPYVECQLNKDLICYRKPMLKANLPFLQLFCNMSARKKIIVYSVYLSWRHVATAKAQLFLRFCLYDMWSSIQMPVNTILSTPPYISISCRLLLQVLCIFGRLLTQGKTYLWTHVIQTVNLGGVSIIIGF